MKIFERIITNDNDNTSNDIYNNTPNNIVTKDELLEKKIYLSKTINLSYVDDLFGGISKCELYEQREQCEIYKPYDSCSVRDQNEICEPYDSNVEYTNIQDIYNNTSTIPRSEKLIIEPTSNGLRDKIIKYNNIKNIIYGPSKNGRNKNSNIKSTRKRRNCKTFDEHYKSKI